MKTLFILILSFITLGTISCIKVSANKAEPRDVKYESYCDSIWYVDRDYYLDVIVETEEYQDYISKHGEWWNI